MPIALFLLIPVLCSASWSDWKERRISNRLVIFAFLLALLINTFTMSFQGLMISIGGAVVGLALLIVPYLMGGIGAGDVKLLMVIGSFGGISLVLSGFICGAILGGLFAGGLLLYNRVFSQNLKFIPYAIPLSLGTLFCIFLEFVR